MTDIDNIFGFYLVTHLTCLTCNYVDMTFDFTTDLILDIISKKKVVNYKNGSDIVQNIEKLNIPNFDKESDTLYLPNPVASNSKDVIDIDLSIRFKSTNAFSK